MRKHCVPIGWPRPDPRHYRFPLPNTVWKYKLKPIEFVILPYLCCFHSHRRNGEKVAAEAVAKTVHLTVDTVKKYLSSMTGRKLITDEFSLAPALQLTDDRKFFTLPNEVFLLNLPSPTFMTYAYLLLVEDRKTHTCHPSYNTIANQTGMARNTVIKSIGVLLDAKFIAMEHSRYFDKHGMKWKGNNLYTILPTQQAVDAYHQRKLQQLELDAIIEVLAHPVPQFFVQIRIGLFLLFHCLFRDIKRGKGLHIAAVQGNAILDVDSEALSVLPHRLHVVADLALQTDVRRQAQAGLRVHTGHIARVRVAVGVSVLHVEQDDKFIVVIKRTDEYISVTESNTSNKALWGGQYFRWWLEGQPHYICYTRYPQ